MSRYVVYNITEQQLKEMYGGTNTKATKALAMVFTDLNINQANQLKADGFTVKEVKDVSIHPTVSPIIPIPGINTYTPEQLFDYVGLTSLRTITNPPLYGKNMNIALIDTGMRETHQLLAGHIIFSMNFTADPMEDGYDHGTGTASIITTVAPQAGIINMKVLDNSGNGTEEEVALGIDYCITMITISPLLAPSVINISLGTADLGDADSPLRVACRAAIAEGMIVIAAAGNGGPGANTIMSPACDPQVIAVGSCNVTDHTVSYFSSRGPTLEGAIKPDCVLFGENIVVASAASDTAVVAKSGTSFAAPLASCMALLSQEGIIRLVSYSGGVPLGLQPSALTDTLTNAKLLDKYLPDVTVKPTASSISAPSKDQQIVKDNDYGYGLPFGTLITQEISPVSNLDISGLIGFMLIMMIMKMMMGMMNGINQPKQVSQPIRQKQLTGGLGF